MQRCVPRLCCVCLSLPDLNYVHTHARDFCRPVVSGAPARLSGVPLLSLGAAKRLSGGASLGGATRVLVTSSDTEETSTVENVAPSIADADRRKSGECKGTPRVATPSGPSPSPVPAPATSQPKLRQPALAPRLGLRGGATRCLAAAHVEDEEEAAPAAPEEKKCVMCGLLFS